MKKTLITLAALAAASLTANAEKLETLPTAQDAVWSSPVAGEEEGTIKYTTSLEGNYTLNLNGIGAPVSGESFTLTIETTTSAWGNEYGLGLVSTGSPYYADYNHDQNEILIYVGNPSTNSASGAIVGINGTKNNLSNEVFAPHMYSSSAETSAPFTLGFSIKFDSVADTITISSTANSDLTFDTLTLDAAFDTYDFSTLKSYGGIQNVDGTYGLPSTASTVISVTKAGELPSVPSGDAVPEPATATLSLLALAGLAARRRRK